MISHQFLTVREVALQVRRSPQTVCRWIREGHLLGTLKVRDGHLIPAVVVQAYLRRASLEPDE